MYFELTPPMATESATALRQALGTPGSLQDVLRWAFALSPPRDVAAVIIQDEYSHDVVIPWTPPLYLAFDTT